ncbi:hypothetical protein [Salininema proteolyticum]|uniref:Uncharacterized protein n=1 Tax=Salininema proteolyticum TaxID=1607685 RepID=A0ABV8U230_9ACTN
MGLEIYDSPSVEETFESRQQCMQALTIEAQATDGALNEIVGPAENPGGNTETMLMSPVAFHGINLGDSLIRRRREQNEAADLEIYRATQGTLVPSAQQTVDDTLRHSTDARGAVILPFERDTRPVQGGQV